MTIKRKEYKLKMINWKWIAGLVAWVVPFVMASRILSDMTRLLHWTEWAGFSAVWFLIVANMIYNVWLQIPEYKGVKK